MATQPTTPYDHSMNPYLIASVGRTSASYGQFWFGGSTFPGFLFKRNPGGGNSRSTIMGAGGNGSCNQPNFFWNRYISGAGVGASSTANRRAKLINATSCLPGQQCGRFYAGLGQNQIRPSQYTTYNSNFS